MKVNDTQLTPLLFLERSAQVYPDKVAFVDSNRRVTYAELADHTIRLARALLATGLEPGDRVAYLAPNTLEMLVAHFAVPLAGGVLVAINTRLSPDEILYIVDHSGARYLLADTDLHPSIVPVVEKFGALDEIFTVPAPASADLIGGTSYPDLLDRGSGEPLPWRVDDEQSPISINYTSGTTGRPKGVLYTHRGAYLNSLSEIIHSSHSPDTVYLWTLPMFHCNGWCTTWAITAIGGRHVGLRAVDPVAIWRLIGAEGVTHFNAAPTVLITLANHADARPFDPPVIVTTAGAPPSPTIIAQMEALNARVVHVYGLTETYGPHTVCEWQVDWQNEAAPDRAILMARQGVAFIGVDPIRVVDDNMVDVPTDGSTMGEVVMRGNNVMEGYFDDPDATEHAFRGGWFHSGDVAVWHPDGYIELRDRSKDIIISGGENISTIEVEQTVMSHPAVLEAAVVAIPHEKWGERPKAFVVLKPGAEVRPEEIIAHVKAKIARFKAPDAVEIVDQLPKTSTGKIQKYVLREREWSTHERRIH
ncbi:MAG: acyl--CoA ligase family protein [Acidimicrobiia bacterium]|nr:acyl--CoA ligase family protein [Acidimicrobiia bacterium]